MSSNGGADVNAATGIGAIGGVEMSGAIAPNVAASVKVEGSSLTSTVTETTGKIPSVVAAVPSVPPVALRNQTIIKPLVYGSIAFYLGKQATETATHKWSIFVRGLEDEDLGYYVKRVIFTLHPSCEIPQVICDSPPYVVTQTGWGEFDVKISIFFRDSAESHVDIIHHLRLYPPGVSSSHSSSLLKKPVVYELYEEVLFNEPMSDWAAILNNPPKDIRKGVSDEELKPHFQKVSEVDSMKQVLAGQTFLAKEIEKTCQELLDVQQQVKELKDARAPEGAGAAAPAGVAGAPAAAAPAGVAPAMGTAAPGIYAPNHGYGAGEAHHGNYQGPNIMYDQAGVPIQQQQRPVV